MGTSLHISVNGVAGNGLKMFCVHLSTKGLSCPKANNAPLEKNPSKRKGLTLGFYHFIGQENTLLKCKCV